VHPRSSFLRRSAPAIIILFFLASPAGCGRAAESAIPSPGSTGISAADFLPPVFTPTATLLPTADGGTEFDVARAMRELYGTEGTPETDSKGRPVIRIPGDPNGADLRDWIIRPVLAAGYSEAGEDKFVLLTETGPEGMGAHSEYARIGGALFRRTGSGWEPEIISRDIVPMGSFGHAPDGALIVIGPDKHAFLFEPQWAGQGSGITYADLLAPVNGSLVRIFYHELKQHSEVGGVVWDYSATMEFVPGPNPAYDDIRLTTTGSKPDGIETKIAPFETVERFTFDGREYVPADGDAA
jgi:hypothetical protein